MSENNTVNTTTNSTPEATGGQSEKLFTQDDVNRIVSERLAREREKAQQPQEDAREQALKARESRLDCRDYLDGKKYPAALLDVLDTADTEKFKATVEALVKACPGVLYKIETRGAEVAHPPVNMSGRNVDEEIKKAFKPKNFD